MKRLLWIIMTLVGCLWTGLAAWGAGDKADPAMTNLIQNGGFEEPAAASKGRLPLAWGVYQIETLKPGEIAIDRQVTHCGRSAVKFQNATHSLHMVISVTPGEVHHFECYFKSSLLKGGAGLGVQWLNASGKWVFDKEGRQITHNKNLYGVSDWRKAELTNIEVPATATRAWITVGPVFGGEGEFWADDVAMRRVRCEIPNRPYRATVMAGKLAAPPTLDGKLGEPVWNTVTELGNFSVPKLKALARRQTTVKIGYTAEALYLAIRCRESGADNVTPGAKWDDNLWAGNCVEIFLAPQGLGPRQFHFGVNAAGAWSQKSEVWHPERHDVIVETNWKPQWVAAAGRSKEGWTAEVKIPFAALGAKAPAVGDRWGFNVTRHFVTTGEEYSSWSPLDILLFLRPDGFGELVFGDQPPAVRSAGIMENRAGIFVQNPSGHSMPCSVRLERPDEGKYWTLAEQAVALAPGVQQLVSLSLGDSGGGMVWTSIFAHGQLIYREGGIPGTEYAALSWYDPEGMLGNRLYVARDLRTFKPFLTTHNFEGGTGGPQMVRRDQKAVDLILELPAGIRATHLVQFLVNWMYWEPLEPAETTPLTRGDKSYVRYRFELPAITSYNINIPYVFFETTLPSGTTDTGYAYLKWDTGQQPPRPLEIHVVEVGRTPPLKKFFNGIYYAEGDFLLTWLPDLGRVYPRLGFNRVEIDPSPGLALGPMGTPAKAVPRELWFDRLVRQVRGSGIFMATAPSQSTPYFQDWCWKDAAARALDVHGKPVHDSRWADCYSLCPLYRGKFFQQHLDKFRSGPTFKKYQLSWLAIDLELWDDAAWEAGCFCPRCLVAFKEFLAARHPHEKVGDPRQFMLDPKAHPREREIWTRFRDWCMRRMIGDFRTPLEAMVARSGRATGPRPGLLVSEWRPPLEELFDVVDYFEINLYHKPTEVARRLGAAVTAVKGRKNIVGTCSPGQTCGSDDSITLDDIRYSIFECAAAGTQGILWYAVFGLDALKLKTIVDGIRTIQPFEDIILDGRCQVEIPCEGGKASARGVSLGPESLVIVRDYLGPANVEAKVTVPCQGNVTVYDCYTREALGKAGPGQSQVTVRLAKERARLLYVGPPSAWDKRFK